MPITLLNTLIKQGKVPLYLDFRTGSLLDKGGMGNDPTVTDCRWSQSHQGRSLAMQPSGTVTVADDASLRLSQLSIVSIARVESMDTGSQHFLDRSNAGATEINYNFFYSSASGLVFQTRDGATLDSSVASLGAGVMQTTPNVGVTWVSAAKPRFFSNSSFLAEGDIVVPAQVLTAGRDVRVGYLNSAYQPKSMAAIVLVNEALSDGDMEQLMSELSITPGVMLRNRTGFSYPGSPRCRLDGRLHRDGSVPCGATQATNVGDIVVPDLWRLIEAGTWDVEELLTGKRILRGSGSPTTVVNQHSSGGDGCIGSWLFEIEQTGGQQAIVGFGLQRAVSLTSTTNDGYAIKLTDTQVALDRIDAGVVTNISTATPVGLDANQMYQFWVTRTGAYSFRVYIKGDVFTDWTPIIGPVTDATYVTGGYTACKVADGGAFGDVVHYDSVMTPSEARVLGIL